MQFSLKFTGTYLWCMWLLERLFILLSNQLSSLLRPQKGKLNLESQSICPLFSLAFLFFLLVKTTLRNVILRKQIQKFTNWESRFATWARLSRHLIFNQVLDKWIEILVHKRDFVAFWKYLQPEKHFISERHWLNKAKHGVVNFRNCHQI